MKRNMFKSQQVLRTAVPLRADGNVQIAPGTRVVVMKTVDGDKVRVKVMDPAHAELNKTRLVAGAGAFKVTHRGRPRKA